MVSMKHILVIGAGFGGVLSIKSLKEEGYEPICYEKTSNAGGTWFYRDEPVEGIPSTMRSTITTHSKEMGTISNFVPDKSYPNYMKAYELYRVFLEIGQKFDCFKHIVYNREVLSVKRADDYDKTGRWEVTVKNTETGESTDEFFDVVWVAVGHFTYPKMPEYLGLEKFRGTIMHTHDLKNLDKFTDKRVLVIGTGNSGVDAAVGISAVASKVYLSTRNGVWILPRIGPGGLPFDYGILRRYVNFMSTFLGTWLSNWLYKKFVKDKHFNHELYNLHPRHSSLHLDHSISDLLPERILTGSVLIRRSVKYVNEKGVIFENQSRTTELDALVMATGYTWKFPFLQDDIITTVKGRINLYKLVFPPQLKHPTLAIIGFIAPFGPGITVGETQTRWAAQVLSGNLPLPSEEDMMKDIIQRHETHARYFAPCDKLSLRISFLPYQDELAREMGCYPNFWRLLFTDFELFKALVFGPSLPYQYRLVGPHKWEGAREAILTAPARIQYPLSGEPIERTKNSLALKHYVLCFITGLMMALWYSKVEISLKWYLAMLVFGYMITWKGFCEKYIISLLLLPIFVTWSGFFPSYLITAVFPPLLASITLSE